MFVPSLPLLSLAEPQWIWTSKSPKAEEKANFRKTFPITGAVKSAKLAVSCDNAATVKLNGTKVAEVTEWAAGARADVAKALKPGDNLLSIEGRNEDGIAALVATLTIEMADGKKVVIETGPDWEGALAGSELFRPAVVIAKHGAEPWGNVLSGRGGGGVQTATDPATLQVPMGFKVELLYTVPKSEQGSWVSMTVDAKGRLIACDQNGGLFRLTVPPIGQSEGTQVEALKSETGGAHGLLYAFNSLYVMVNEKAARGLWRLRDGDGDDQFEQAEQLRKIDGSGEHGPHGVILSPDGKSLFFADGNHTKVPEKLDHSRAVKWGEDHLLPRLWDANGHAQGILAPGGAVFKSDPDAKFVELFALGFRNEYDISFNAEGEMFTFDSDMEWDIGTPWYRPTRIVHVVSGGDYGWRSGAGKWPAYYPDSLPPTLDIGPGSPTGVVFGTGAKFPAKYQRAFYAADWTYGTMYAIHLTPDGATYRAEKEEFVAGKPLPLSDMVIHPKDGAMYFLIGGRKVQSALYRVTYTGSESTAAAPRVEATAEARLRHELEQLHLAGTGPEAIDKAWPHLGHADRFVRYAARVAIERQPADQWADRALNEKNPQAAVEALVALARVGDKALQPRLLEALGSLDLQGPVQLPLLRAWELAFTRMGKPAPDVCAQLAAKFDAIFPAKDSLANRELVQLLVFLDSPRVVAKTVPLLSTARDDHQAIASDAVLARNEGYAGAAHAMHGSRPNGQQISYAYALRNARVGWTPELRKEFFAWFPRTRAWKGGNSFSKFLDNIRKDALANAVPDAAERTALDESSRKVPAPPAENFVVPKGPGKAYSVQDVVAVAESGLKGRDFENGKAMFASTFASTATISLAKAETSGQISRARQPLHYTRSCGKHRRSFQGHQ